VEQNFCWYKFQISKVCFSVLLLPQRDMLLSASRCFSVLLLLLPGDMLLQLTICCIGVQIGDEVPDVAPAALKGAWEATQELLRQRKISAGHDISDGGLAVALLEMAFSGNTGLTVSPLCSLFCPGSRHD
jgi:hypothetical protein